MNLLLRVCSSVHSAQNNRCREHKLLCIDMIYSRGIRSNNVRKIVAKPLFHWKNATVKAIKTDMKNIAEIWIRKYE